MIMLNKISVVLVVVVVVVFYIFEGFNVVECVL